MMGRRKCDAAHEFLHGFYTFRITGAAADDQVLRTPVTSKDWQTSNGFSPNKLFILHGRRSSLHWAESHQQNVFFLHLRYVRLTMHQPMYICVPHQLPPCPPLHLINPSNHKGAHRVVENADYISWLHARAREPKPPIVRVNHLVVTSKREVDHKHEHRMTLVAEALHGFLLFLAFGPVGQAPRVSAGVTVCCQRISRIVLAR